MPATLMRLQSANGRGAFQGSWDYLYNQTSGSSLPGPSDTGRWHSHLALPINGFGLLLVEEVRTEQLSRCFRKERLSC